MLALKLVALLSLTALLLSFTHLLALTLLAIVLTVFRLFVVIRFNHFFLTKFNFSHSIKFIYISKKNSSLKRNCLFLNIILITFAF